MTSGRDWSHAVRHAIARVWFGALAHGAVGLVLAGVVLPQVKAQQPATAATSLVLDGVTVVDVEHGKLIPSQRAVIVGSRIRAVGSVSAVKMPTGAQVVQARGKYLIPGLWDMHTHPLHFTDYFYPLFVANGVTGIRDAGSDVPLDTLVRWRQEVLDGRRVGPPRQILSGRGVEEGPFCSSIAGTGAMAPCVPRADSAAARQLVDSLQAAGADMIKMYALSREMYFVIAAEARRLGIPFGGHIAPPTDVSAALSGEPATVPTATAVQASDSGVKLLDHVHSSGGLDALCLGPESSVDQCRPLAERFRRNGTWWVPTLIRGILCDAPEGKPDVKSASDSVCVRSYEITKRFLAGAVPNENWLQGAASVDSAGSLRFLSTAHRAGLPILAGTDVGAFAGVMAWQVPGFTLHAELATYVAEGLTPLEALQAATYNAAQMLHATDSLGTVAPGKLADLVLLDANPLADITNTTTIRAVIANGRYFDRAILDKLLIEAQAKVKELPTGQPKDEP